MVVGDELVGESDEGAIRRAGRARRRHSSFTERTNRSACALQFGAPAASGRHERPPWRATAPPRRSTSDRDRRPGSSLPEESIRLATDGPQALDDECFVRIRHRAKDLDTPGLQFDQECSVVRHEPSRGPRLGCEEVGSDECRPVRLSETSAMVIARCLPAECHAARWTRAIVERPTRWPNVLQRTLNPCVAPRRISVAIRTIRVRRCVCGPATTRGARLLGPFASDQFTMPAENRVRCDNRRHLREQTTSRRCPSSAEASSLAVVETYTPSTEPELQDSILFSQKGDRIGLLTMKPRTHRHDEQLKRSHARSIGDRVDPVVERYRGVSRHTPRQLSLRVRPARDCL